MSLILTYLRQQGAKKAALQKVLDEPNKNAYPGALGCLIKQSDPNNEMSLINTDMIDKVKASWAQDATIVKQVTEVPTIVTSRSFTVAGPANTSSLVLVTPGYIGSSMTVYPSQHLNANGDLNMVTLQEDLDRKLGAVMNGLVNKLEEAALAKLQAIKTKVLNNPLSFDFTADTVIATNAQRLDVVSASDVLIKGNNYNVGDMLDIVGDAGALQIMRDIRKFGANNEQNQAQFLDGKTFWLTNSMPAAVGKQAAMFVVPMGSFAILFRIQPIALNGYTTSDWQFGTIDGTGYGIPTELELIRKASAADVSAATGNPKDTASVKEEYILGVDFAMIEALGASEAGAKTPVLEILVNTAATDADVTAPLVDTVTSAALTSLVVDFDSAMAIDAAGDVAISEATSAQLAAALDLTVATPGAAIDTITASADNTQLTITLDPTTDLAAADYITVTLYDGAGNAFAADSGKIAQVNAGGTAWEAIP